LRSWWCFAGFFTMANLLNITRQIAINGLQSV
jgi:hypothetical protein